MQRTVAALLVGLVAGAIAAWFIAARQPGEPPEVVRDIVAVPKMSFDEGDRHREQNFERLLTVEQILALPSRFMQAEALHVLAGRSSSAEIQNLIFESNRISDEQEREVTLSILFRRLAELDPQSALALARSDYLRGSGATVRDVWMAYGLNDIDAALAAAKTQPNQYRNVAAQALFSAYGYMGNEVTDRIESELGIKPSRANRARFLYRLADRSPSAAAAYINSIESQRTRREAVYWLAGYLNETNPDVAASIEPLFTNASDRQTYASIVAQESVRTDPRAVLDQLISGDRSTLNPRSIGTALQAIAASDIDAAMAYYDQLPSRDHRQSLGAAIVVELAKSDFDAAMAWARANESTNYPSLTMQLLQQVANDDPQRAISQALAYDDPQWREMLVSGIARSMAYRDPATAIRFAEQVQSPRQRANIGRQVLSQWVQNDPDAAVSWVLSQDPDVARQYLQDGSQIIHENPGAAIRLLPLLDEDVAVQWRHQIAQNLAAHRSPEEAMAFVNRFQGQAGFESLQSSVIWGVANRDPDRALIMANQLTDPRARDSAYAQIANQKAATNPQAAVALLEQMSDRYRDATAGNIAAQWARLDPPSARRWVESLPRGRTRDSAIAQYITSLDAIGPSERELLESIDSREMREQAKIGRIYVQLRTDPASVRDLLDDPDISEVQRQRIRMMIDQQGVRGY